MGHHDANEPSCVNSIDSILVTDRLCFRLKVPNVLMNHQQKKKGCGNRFCFSVMSQRALMPQLGVCSNLRDPPSNPFLAEVFNSDCQGVGVISVDAT